MMDPLWELVTPYRTVFFLIAARLAPLAPKILPRSSGLFTGWFLVLGIAAYFTFLLGPRQVSPSVFPAALAVNFLIGVVLATGFHIMLGIWLSFGELMDSLRGSRSEMQIPGLMIEGSSLAGLYALLGILYFLAVSGPLISLSAIGRQFSTLPLEAPWVFFQSSHWIIAVLNLVGILFTTLAMLLLPVFLVLFFLEFSLGFLSVWLPQTQPYFLMMPIRQLAVLLLLVLINPLILRMIGRTIQILMAFVSRGG